MFKGYNVLFMLITIWWPTGSSDNICLVTFDTFFLQINLYMFSDLEHWPMI